MEVRVVEMLEATDNHSEHLWIEVKSADGHSLTVRIDVRDSAFHLFTRADDDSFTSAENLVAFGSADSEWSKPANMVDLCPLAGDVVDGNVITRVWGTGKVDLSNGHSVHIRQLDYVAGSESGATFTVARPYNPHEAGGMGGADGIER